VVSWVTVVAIFLSNIPEGLSSSAGTILSMLVDTMIPEAFQETHDYAA
jgi:zinc transporter ZupT